MSPSGWLRGSPPDPTSMIATLSAVGGGWNPTRPVASRALDRGDERRGRPSWKRRGAAVGGHFEGFLVRKKGFGRRCHAAASQEPAPLDEAPRKPLEERLAEALAEDTSLPKNPRPLTIPPLPDLRELAEMASLDVTDEEVEEWTPKVHGILNWFGKLNDVDLDAARKDVELYRDKWVMPLRPDEAVDFPNRDAMFEESRGRWEKPFVKVPKVDVKEGNADAAADAAAAACDAGDGGGGAELTPEILGMEFKVGRVLSVKKHPDAEKLYIEEVDCGEETGPRTICSGLVPYMSEDDIAGKNVVVLANLKARNMAGVPSSGMLLCANNGEDGDARVVELLIAPEGAKPGERLTWGGAQNDDAHGVNKVAKKKIWEKVQPGLATTDECVASWCGTTLTSAAGPVTCKSVKGGGIS